MSTEVHCSRCLRTAIAIEGGTFYTKELEQEVRARVCLDCWREWQRAEVMVINELRLNFMDPKSIDILTQHMREFLLLDGSGPNLPPGIPTG